MKPGIVFEVLQDAGGQLGGGSSRAVGKGLDILGAETHAAIDNREPVGEGRAGDKIRTVEVMERVSKVVHVTVTIPLKKPQNPLDHFFKMVSISPPYTTTAGETHPQNF